MIGADQRQTFLDAGLVLQEIGVIKPDVDVKAVVDALVDTSYLNTSALNTTGRR